MHTLISTLKETHDLPDDGFAALLDAPEVPDDLRIAADSVRRSIYGTDVYIRGLIEFSNICRNDCLYCGIRRSGSPDARYRLTPQEILACCAEGYELGFRTFVLQGGEDPWFTDDVLAHIASEIKKLYPDCALTLSAGEKSRESYARLFEAGADRYLLRHETADTAHYASLHPADMRLETRMKCLFDLKDIGYAVGSGMMVGSRGQTTAHLVKDLRFLQQLQPDMIGIGPFIPAPNTPFGSDPPGSIETTLRLISILRLMFPAALIPATTALGTLHPAGREKGLMAGANVVMPNLSPLRVRSLYSLYANKICTGEEAAECKKCLEKRVEAAGYRVVTSAGHPKTLRSAAS